MTRTTVDVVIVNWNSGAYLRSCLDAIDALPPDERAMLSVTVVDNASDDGSPSWLEERDGIDVRVNATNVGFARACNQGASLGSAEFILFLNPDTEPRPGAIGAAVEAIRRGGTNRVGACGVQLVTPAGTVDRSCSRFPRLRDLVARSIGLHRLGASAGALRMIDWDHRESRVVDQVMGAFLTVPRSVFTGLGGFDERFEVYFEDVDFAIRLRRAGYVSYFEAAGQCLHVGGGASGTDPARRDLLFAQSELRFAAKYFGRFGFVVVVLAVLVVEPVVRAADAVVRGDALALRRTGAVSRVLWSWLAGRRR